MHLNSSNYIGPDRLDDASVHREVDRFIHCIPSYSANYSGRGIVICAGGLRYLGCAWVCIRMLRHVGCSLPIELWHLGPAEMDATLVQHFRRLNTVCVDGFVVQKKAPARILNGWELKAYAIIHSQFEEVLLIDADNVAVVNPEFLFDTPQYLKTGAIFWPDFGRLEPTRSIWAITGVSYRDEPEFESGQVIVHKKRSWKALQLTKWFNDYSDYFYHHIHGDKETFHMAWRKLEQSYSMPARGIHAIHATMCQHDFDGRRIFQHRNMAKWDLVGKNPRIHDFWHEDECLDYLEEFRQTLVENKLMLAANRTNEEQEAFAELTRNTYLYVRVGHDMRPMRFSRAGHVGLGAGGCEVFWRIETDERGVCLDILSGDERTCRLRRCADSVWRGEWVVHEKMPIDLVPVPRRLMSALPN